ncbi:MAG: signal peptidase I [bacterium]|nr:signal peptidase I [bacterium]
MTSAASEGAAPRTPVDAPPPATTPRAKHPWSDYLEALLIAVIFATFARSFVLQAFKIPSSSMEENLLVGDHILVNKFIYGPTYLEGGLLPAREVRPGDITVFRFPEEPTRDFIKRCIGVAGDRIEIRDKVVFVNGEPLDESAYVLHRDPRIYPRSIFLSEEYRRRDNFGPITVPEGELFFLGDNRDDSHDSRFWGTVPREFVKGRALIVYWSFDAAHQGTGWPGLGPRLRQLLEVVVKFPARTRWRRSLRLIR